MTWSVSDGESPGRRSRAAARRRRPATAATALTCSATSAGGTTTRADDDQARLDAADGARDRRSGARTYSPRSLPRAAALACRATRSDVRHRQLHGDGLRRRHGRHTLTAVALNDAGLTSTSSLSYTVVKPAAISRLELARGASRSREARALGRLPATSAWPRPRTHLAVSLVARIGARRIVLGRITKRAASGQVGAARARSRRKRGGSSQASRRRWSRSRSRAAPRAPSARPCACSRISGRA